LGNLSFLPVTAFQYKQIETFAPEELFEEAPVQAHPEIRLSEDAFHARLAAERAAGFAEAESRLRHELERKVSQQTDCVTRAIQTFEQSRAEYFASVEVEVVQLALAIARRILHREAQVDPMLVAAIVQLALGQLREGSTATMRVALSEAARWKRHFEAAGLKLTIHVEGDPAMHPGDCVLQTEMGSATFGIDAQLKEVEQGFFDVLARRPRP
jgi:flagellar assembly protein FliH